MTASRQNPIPECLPGFEKINRYWDPKHHTVAAKILPGEYYVTEHDELVSTVLGSCISVCVYEPERKIGGMNHFMLPQSQGGASDIMSGSFRYGDVAMERLINDLLRNGAERSRLVFKAFGGGKILRKMTDIGERNIAFLNTFMDMENFVITKSDLGGIHPRKVNFYPASGKVMMKRLKDLHNETIFERESNYSRQIDTPKPVSGDIDLF